MHARGILVVLGVWVVSLPLGVRADSVSTQVPPTHLPPRQAQPPINHQPQPDLAILDQLARTYQTPKAIATFLRNEFTFKRDEDLFGEVDYWQSPEEFATRRIGDCEDYALLAQALLRRNGIEAYVLSLFGDEEGYAHTVAVFVDEQGRYNLINQEKIRVYHAKSLEALASALYPAWTYGGVVERQGTHGHMVREIYNDHPAPLMDQFASF